MLSYIQEEKRFFYMNYKNHPNLSGIRSGINFTKRWAGFQSELAFTHLLLCADNWLDFLKASPFFFVLHTKLLAFFEPENG